MAIQTCISFEQTMGCRVSPPWAWAPPESATMPSPVGETAPIQTSRTCKRIKVTSMGPPGSQGAHASSIELRPTSDLDNEGPSLPSGSQPQGPEESDGDVSGPDTPEAWQGLLPDLDVFGPRARSASDAAVLRRKGHLKEQDALIEFILEMHKTHTALEVMQKMERWIREHRQLLQLIEGCVVCQTPRRSWLSRMVPSIGSFFTPLNLVDAFLEYDTFFALSRRRYIPPNFAEIRHVLNIAQVRESAKDLRLITFDADGTLYADGMHMEHDNQMIRHIIHLMRHKVHVAIVTAAGYPGEAQRFEQRLKGLLTAFQQLRLPPEVVCRYKRFHTLSFPAVQRCALEVRLHDVWQPGDIQGVLNSAQALLLESAARLRVPVQVVRKERAVGVVPLAPTVYEVLEEMAITVQEQLYDTPVPFLRFQWRQRRLCGHREQVSGLGGPQAMPGPSLSSVMQVLHVGDRFTKSGNDATTRDCCSILWVANAEETSFFINMLLSDIRVLREQPYLE
eukprot:jgi/Botrbrau1/13023/Bobra.0389s0016.1